MRKQILLLMLILIPAVLHAQNAVVLLKSLRSVGSAEICRTISVPHVYAMEALNIGLNQGPNVRLDVYDDKCKMQVQIQRELLLNSIKSPETVYGPYIYMRSFVRATQDETLVNSKFVEKWRKIHQTRGYNGAHHLISKSTIELIYKDLKAQGKSVSLKEMQNNAPSIFHPFHGNPLYNSIFHDTEKQYYDYKRFGMHVTILSLLERIDELNVKIGLKPMPEQYIKGVLREAQLWAKYYGIIW